MSKERLQKLTDFLAKSPKDPFLIFAIGKEYENMGNDENAKERYLDLKDNHPEYIGTYYHLAKLLERMNDMAGAKETYRIGMEHAKTANDLHALSELNQALEQISGE